MYRTVALIRRFEERAIELVRSGEIAGGIHPYIGQEAIAAGVCAALRDDDIITSTHRGHGHVLAKGADPVRMLAELAGRATGLNQGRGGSMHAADFSLGIYGANGIVGAGGPIAVGAAWAHRGAGRDLVAVSFFGDGAVNQGVLLESLNLAALWHVPVLFVCENNGYATTLTVEQAVAGTITGRAAAFGIPSSTVDGMDVAAVHAAADEAVRRARAGEGPTLIECLTLRMEGHAVHDDAFYVPGEMFEEWAKRDPLERFREWLRENASLTDVEEEDLAADVKRLLADAARRAEESPLPEGSSVTDGVYAGPEALLTPHH
jgi:pyruvate dehydrogenase E1 component alpha subunit